MKKILSLVLALTLALSLNVGAMAANVANGDKDTLTGSVSTSVAYAGEGSLAWKVTVPATINLSKSNVYTF